MSAVDACLADWLRRFELIELDVQELLLRRHLFQELGEIVEANPTIQRPSYLYEYLAGTYAAAATIAVRRHAKAGEAGDASLLGLLYGIRDNAKILTRARHIALYQEVGADPRLAEREFDRLAEERIPHLERRHVQPLIDELLRTTTDLTPYADKRVAHLDLKGPQKIPDFADLDRAIDAVEKATK